MLNTHRSNHRHSQHQPANTPRLPATLVRECVELRKQAKRLVAEANAGIGFVPASTILTLLQTAEQRDLTARNVLTYLCSPAAAQVWVEGNPGMFSYQARAELAAVVNADRKAEKQRIEEAKLAAKKRNEALTAGPGWGSQFAHRVTIGQLVPALCDFVVTPKATKQAIASPKAAVVYVEPAPRLLPMDAKPQPEEGDDQVVVLDEDAFDFEDETLCIGEGGEVDEDMGDDEPLPPECLVAEDPTDPGFSSRAWALTVAACIALGSVATYEHPEREGLGRGKYQGQKAMLEVLQADDCAGDATDKWLANPGRTADQWAADHRADLDKAEAASHWEETL